MSSYETCMLRDENDNDDASYHQSSYPFPLGLYEQLTKLCRALLLCITWTFGGVSKLNDTSYWDSSATQ